MEEVKECVGLCDEVRNIQMGNLIAEIKTLNSVVSTWFDSALEQPMTCRLLLAGRWLEDKKAQVATL